MKLVLIILLLCLVIVSVKAQTENPSIEYNLGFERVSNDAKLPDNWNKFGASPDYDLRIDIFEKRSGNNSVLIEHSAGEKAENSFGSIRLKIPAEFDGNEIELRGYLKLKDVAGGYAGMFLRIDGSNGILQFNNMFEQSLQGTKDWTEYSIKLSLPKNARTIFVGALLTGTGKLWVDDFQVFFDGKDIKETKRKPIVEYKAEKDKEFDAGSTVNSIRLTRTNTENLATLGKVWGFLKYHHPAVTRGDYNWDYELFRILPKILAAENRNLANSMLSAWIESFGKIEKGEAANIDATKIKLNPDLFWINAKGLGSKLANQLNELKTAKRGEESYYVELAPKVGNPVFNNEKPFATMKYSDAGFRLLSLFRYWNIIRYYFPYRHLIEENWENVLVEFLPKFADAADELEYKKAVLALIARIHDTHAFIWGADETLERFEGINYAPVEVTFVENKAVVTGFYHDELAKKIPLKFGDVIETVNGKKVANIVKEKLPFTPASNYPTQLREIAVSNKRKIN